MEKATVQSIDRALSIIETLAGEKEGLGVTEISTRVGLHKSTVHRLLSALGERGYVEQRQLEGKSVILDIEVQGASQIVRNCPDAVTVFILPPSGEELERRLRHRNTDSDEKIRERLLQAKRECAEAGKYGYIVINDDPDAAAREVNAILTAEKCKAADRLNLVTEVLIS